MSALLLGVLVVCLGFQFSKSSPNLVLGLLTFGVMVSTIGLEFGNSWTVFGEVRLCDLLSFALLVAGTIRLIKFRLRVSLPVIALLTYSAAILMLSQLLDAHWSVSGWRYWIAACGCLLYGTTVKFKNGEVLKLSVLVCVTASILVILVQCFNGSLASRFIVPDLPLSGRPLQAEATLFLALTLLCLISGAVVLYSRDETRLSIFVCAVALFSLQQRTVWLAFLVGLPFALWVRRSKNELLSFDVLPKSSRRGLLWVVLLLTMCIMTFVLGSLTRGTTDTAAATPPNAPASSVSDEQLGLGDSFTDTRNLGWRISVWEGAFQESQGVSDLVFGVLSNERLVSGWSPHNTWIESVRRVGIVGSILLGLALFSALFQNKKRTRAQQSLGLVVVPVLLVYGLAYPVAAFAFVIVGMALGNGQKIEER